MVFADGLYHYIFQQMDTVLRLLIIFQEEKIDKKLNTKSFTDIKNH